MAVSATVFEILTLKARKLLNFPTDPCLRPPFGGNPLEFGDEIWRQKTRVLGLPDGEEIMPLGASFLRFDTIPARDRRTDRHVAIAITRASIASRG